MLEVVGSIMPNKDGKICETSKTAEQIQVILRASKTNHNMGGEFGWVYCFHFTINLGLKKQITVIRHSNVYAFVDKENREKVDQSRVKRGII